MKCRDAEISGISVFYLTDSETENMVSRWTAFTNVESAEGFSYLKANLQTRSQYDPWKSFEPSSQSSFDVVLMVLH